MEIEHWAESINAARRAYQLNPARSTYAINYLGTLFFTGNFEEINDIATKVLRDANMHLSAGDKCFVHIALSQTQTILGGDFLKQANTLVSTCDSDVGANRALGLCTAAQLFLLNGSPDNARSLLNKVSITSLKEIDYADRAGKAMCLVIDSMLSDPGTGLEKLAQAKKLMPQQDTFYVSWIIDLAMGVAYEYTGDHRRAEGIYRDIFQQFTSGDKPSNIVHAIAGLALSQMLSSQGKTQEALDVLDKSAADEFVYHIPLLLSSINYHRAKYLSELGKNKQAIHLFIETQKEFRQLGHLNAILLPESYDWLAASYISIGDYENAEKACRDGLASIDDSDDSLKRTKGALLNRLGINYSKKHDYYSARKILNDAYKLIFSISGTDFDYEIAENLYYKGNVEMADRQFSAAHELLQHAFAIELQVLGSDSLSRAQTERELAAAEYYLFNYSQADLHSTHVRQIYDKAYGKNDWRTLDVRIDHVIIMLDQGDYLNAFSQAQSIYTFLKGALEKPDAHENMVDILTVLAESSIALHNLDAAKRFAKDLLDYTNGDEAGYGRIKAWLVQARLALKEKRADSALKWTGLVLNACEANADPFSARAPQRCALASVLKARTAKLNGDSETALALIHTAINNFIAIHAEFSPELANAYIFLADILHDQGDSENSKQALSSAINILIRDFGSKHFLVTQLQNRISLIN
jgi:hypothetical protein